MLKEIKEYLLPEKFQERTSQWAQSLNDIELVKNIRRSERLDGLNHWVLPFMAVSDLYFMLVGVGGNVGDPLYGNPVLYGLGMIGSLGLGNFADCRNKSRLGILQGVKINNNPQLKGRELTQELFGK
jgi:hypothetical protein